MDKLLVTGVDGIAGGNLAMALAGRFEVIGISLKHAVQIDGLTTTHCDERDGRTLLELAGDVHPQWIIHCGPLARSSWDLDTTRQDAQQEAQIALHVARLAELMAGRLTVVSTDAVFSGPRLFHEEDWPTTATTPCAQHARAMEQALAPTAALMVRTHVYGFSPVVENVGFAEQALESLCCGATLSADGRRHATPILASDLAELLLRAFELRLQGLYHVGGAERTSPYRFVSELALAFDLPTPNVCVAPADLPLGRRRYEEETSLSSRRARRALERPLPLLREGLGRFAEQSRGPWRDCFQNTEHALTAAA